MLRIGFREESLLTFRSLRQGVACVPLLSIRCCTAPGAAPPSAPAEDAPAPPSEPPSTEKALAKTVDVVIPAIAHPVRIPKGFRAYYPAPNDPQGSWKARLPLQRDASIDKSLVQRADEALTIMNARTYRKKLRRRYQLAGVGLLIGSYFVFRYCSREEYHLTNAGDPAAVERLLREKEAVIVSINPADHSAILIKKSGSVGEKFSFVNFEKLEEVLETLIATGKWAGGVVLLNTATAFPLLPLAMLWLIPLLMYMNATVVLVNRMVTRMAGDKAAFKFRKDVEVNTRLADIAGMTEAKHEVMEVVDFLKNTDKYAKLGAR
jgi:AFG3 family protein